MRKLRTLKQCEKIAQGMIETMYHVAFISNEELVVYIYNVKGNIHIQVLKRGEETTFFKDKQVKKEYHVKKLCESYFYNSPFGILLDTPDEEDLAKKIYNYQRKAGVKNEL